MDLMSLLAKLTLDKTEYDKGMEDAQDTANGFKMPDVKVPKPDTKDYTDGLDEAENEASIFQQVVTGVWQGLKDSIVQAGVTGVVLGLANSMKQGISLVVDGGKAIADNSKNLQISTKAYQEYDYVLGKSNLSMKDLAGVMSNIEKARAGEMTEKQAKAFQALGISAEDAKSGIMSAEDMLNKVTSSLAGYEGSDKGWIIDTLFGKNQNWTGYFEQTTEEIEALKTEANKMGLIISDESIQNAVEFKNAAERISNTFEGLKTSFGESILPIITEAVNGVERIVKFLTSDKRTLSQVLGDYDKDYNKEIAEIQGKATQASILIDKLLSMGDPSKLTEQEFAVWKGTAEAAISLIPSLAEQIDIETGKIDGNTASLKANIQQWEELAKQKAMQSLYEQKYAAVVEKMSKITDEQIKLNQKEAEAVDKKQVAIQKANEYLHDEEEGAYRQQIFGMTEVNEDNFAQALMLFTELEGEAGDAMKAYNKVANEIYGIKDNIESLTADYEKGMQEYTEWSTAAASVVTTLNSDAASAAGTVGTLQTSIDNLPDEKHISITVDQDGFPNAIGNAYVPYDNYPALLHRGERVLTATENRRSESKGVDYTHLEDRIAAAIRAGMAGASVNAYLNGKSVTDEVNRNNMQSIKGRRFSR